MCVQSEYTAYMVVWFCRLFRVTHSKLDKRIHARARLYFLFDVAILRVNRKVSLKFSIVWRFEFDVVVDSKSIQYKSKQFPNSISAALHLFS